MKPTKAESPTVLPSDSLVPLESVLCTEELNRRPTRPPDYQAENRALVALVQALADSPRTILQILAEKILEVFHADSAGISLLTGDGKRFHWPAIAGTWQPHIGGGTPRDFGPCGDVLDRNAPLLFRHFERRYAYFLPVTPPVEECLLVPFYVEGKAVGTIWAIAHDDRRKFDSEDLRLLVSLGTFASSAYQAVASLDALEQTANELRQYAADMSESDRRKNEFLAMLAHELRNPLAPIRNALQIVRLTKGNEKAVQPAFEIMERQVGQMALLVDDLLDVSRISQGSIELRTGHAELTSVVNQAVEAVRPLCENMSHELTVTLPRQPVYLNGDKTRLVQVVGNLLNNACKFTDRGGRIELVVSVEWQQESGEWRVTGDEKKASGGGSLATHHSPLATPFAVIRVRDSGIGLAADEFPRIFEMFTQVDTSLERSASGLGIGLMLVKKLVEMHDGTVEVHSAGLGQGSEFVVRLPILVETPQPPPPEPTVSEPPPTTPRRILVVDDNRDSAESLAELLKLTGHETHTAYDGLEAVAAAATLRPDVVLLDIGMPKMNGYEAARKIRDQPWGKDMVLVALTGWGQDEDRRKSIEAGFNGHLVKPVEHADLVKLLAELAAQQNPR